MKKTSEMNRTPLLEMSVVAALTANAFFLFSRLQGDVSFSLFDIRFWPWWFLSVPILLGLYAMVRLHAVRKKQWRTLLFLFCVFLSVGSLVAGEKTISMTFPQRAVTDQEIDLALRRKTTPRPPGGYDPDPAVVKCFAAMECRFTGGRYQDSPIHFRLHTPDQVESGKKYPLILWFHGQGESGDENMRQLSHIQSVLPYLAGKNKRDFFMIATQCPKDNNQWNRSVSSEGNGDSPLAVAAAMMEAVVREFPVDENRIGVFGLSSGGNAAWEFSRRHSDRIAAMVACSALPPSDTIKPDEFVMMPIWVFNNKGDGSVSYGESQRFVEAINARGGSAYATFYDDAGHDSWTRALREEQVLGWLLLQSKDGSGPPQGFSRELSGSRQFLMFGLPVLIVVAFLSPRFLFFRNRRNRSCE